MNYTPQNGAHRGTPAVSALMTPPACESVKIKVEPLEQPPPPPTSLTRLIETAVASPSNSKLERCFVEETPSQVVPTVWSFPSGPSPCTPTYYGVNSAYAVPVYYVPCVNQMPLQAAQLQPAVVASPIVTYAPYQCADSARSEEMRATNDIIAEQETAHDDETLQIDRGQTPDNLDHSAQSTCVTVDDEPKPRRRDSSPPVLCTDSPRTIAYCYERAMEDRAQAGGHHFASAGSGQGRITGVPVFIQSNHSDGALLDVHPVDLFVAVSMIAGTAPSQHRLTATGCLLVDMPSVEGVNRLLHSERLCGVEVKVSIPDAYQKSSSVIRGVPTSYTEDELLDLLRPQGVIHVKRLVRYTAEDSARVSKKPTGKVVLTFPRNSERPGKVEIGDEKYKLREFVDRPARCYRCQRLGHVSKHCASKLRCKRCCGPHDIKECPRDRPRRCANCGGPHYPSYKGCRAYAQMLRSVKSFLNVT